MKKYFNKDTLIAIVGLLTVLLGWSADFGEEVINAVLVAFGSAAMLQDTLRKALSNSTSTDE